MERTDGELLRGFAAGGAPDAFEELVRRHSRLVLGVCRSHLGQAQDAEDAAQAVFLILARKAGTLGDRANVGGWLQRTAVNVCRHARRAREVRRTHEEEAAAMNETWASGRQDSERIAEWVHEALADIPERYRTPIVLCDLQGYSLDDAGRKLGTTGGTVGSWLSRGRAHLRRALLRHGEELPIAALMPGISETLKAVCVREEFVSAATQTGASFASGGAGGGVSGGTVASLAKGAMKMMMWEQIKVAATVAVGVAIVGSTVTVAALQKSGLQTSSPDRQTVSEGRTGSAASGTNTVASGSGGPLEIVKASYFGTGAGDDMEGAAEGPDGSLYLVGNAGSSVGVLPGNVVPNRFGGDQAEPLCGHGFVLKVSADASRVLGYAELGRGILHATAVAAASNAVYVGGYATDGLEPLLKERKGLMTAYPLRAEQTLIRDGKMLEANGFAADKEDPVKGRPWLNRLGAPCVLRFSKDLKTLESGTYLEGWQQVYDKNRNCGRDREGNRRGPFQEFFWQPINVCVLKGGDVAVAHDGGYFRMLTEKDEAFVEKTVARLVQENWQPVNTSEANRATPMSADERRGYYRSKLRQMLAFYDVSDYVSRLSGDLVGRVWKAAIQTPPTDPSVVARLYYGWPHAHYSNPRTHRMRMDAEENLWVAGWSASFTSQEPWWSPFLWKLDSKTGQPTKKLYEYDPMSGGGNRMGGTVADTALVSVSVENGTNLLTCLISDGGNCVMGLGPRGNEGQRMLGPVDGPGLGKSPAHFWGQTHRVDGKTFDGLGGAKTGPYAWTIDAAGLPDGNFLAVGRWNAPLPWTPDAWWQSSPLPNPNAFLRVVGPDYKTAFWTAIPGVRPYEVVPISGERYLVVGFAVDGAAPMKESLAPVAPGGEDAWFAVLKWRSKSPEGGSSPVNPGVLSQGRHGAFSRKAAEGPHLSVAAATYFGGAGIEEFVGAAQRPDGSLIVLGNAADALPAGCPSASILGGEDTGPGGLDKTGILIGYDAEMSRIVTLTRFPWGAADIACVCASPDRQQVYLAGRATPAWASRGAQTFGLTGSAKVGGGTVGAYVIEMGTASTQVTRFWTIEAAPQAPRAIFTDGGSNVYVDVGVPIRIGADRRDIRVIANRTSSGKWPGKWLAVDPKDGSLYWGGDRNTSTGQEPYRQPFLYRFDGDGNKLSTLWEPAPREIGSGPGGGNLQSDSSIRAVTWDRDGRKMIVAGWSDGGNTVFGRQATNWHVSAGSRIGMGMDSSGMKGANSLASLMVLNVASRSTEGVLSWASYVPSWFQDAKHRGAPNAASIEKLVTLPDGSVAISGKAATGLVQTPNAFWKDPMTGEKHGGLYVAVFRPDFSNLMFSSYLPGYEEAALCPVSGGLLVCGRTTGNDGGNPSTGSPAFRAVQPAFGGDRDAHAILLRLPREER